MAKHAKNNIISYDEAKKKKLHEKQERDKRAGKHIRNDGNEEFYDDGYNDDAPNYETSNNTNRYSRVNEQRHPEDYSEKSNEKTAEREVRGKYAQQKEPLPRNLVNLIVVVVMTLFLVFISVMLYNFYVVEDINVIGNESIKYHEITELCGVEYKQSMMSVNKEDIVASFESKMPMIEVVEVKKIWPNVLEITVKERPPICYIVLKGSQKCALIGENNICLSIVDSYLQGDLPRIYGLDVGTGELGKKITDGETRKLEVLKQLIDAMIETECISEIESININNTTNITMVSTSGTNIKAGDTSNLVNKFSIIKIGIQRLISENNTDVTMVVPGDNTFHIE